MAKITVGEVVMEGTIEELREWAELSGVEFPAKAEDACEEVPEEATEKEQLNVGEYVRLLEGKYEANRGDVVIITYVDEDDDECPYKGELVRMGKNIGWLRGERVTRATDEEVAEAKAELERKVESAKWAKIGRKPKELKEGDLVKYRNKSFAEVTRVGIYDISVKMPNGSIIPVIFESVTLIAPVEARFDA